MLAPLPLGSTDQERAAHYASVQRAVDSLLGEEGDWVAAMATVACELHNSFSYFHWTGFYRVVSKDLLRIGPYQGGHGCLEIPFARGVCGKAARTGQTQRHGNVNEAPDHIACSASTMSELVVPISAPDGTVTAVLDVDSNDANAFRQVDQKALEKLCDKLGAGNWDPSGPFPP